MIINFVANYQSGYVGEVADETHIARELKALGHQVRQIPRDAWREYVIEKYPKGKYDVPRELKADINLIAKWHHFYDESFINALREKSGAPVFYWVWDYMDDQGIPEWHTKAVEACDLYLSNEMGIADKYNGKLYYFPFDNCDEQIDRILSTEKHYDVTFLGSYLHQGDRIPILKYINQHYPIQIFSWNWEEWKKEGFEAKPSAYGEDFAIAVARSKLVLGINVNDKCWGYWSNRVGKVLSVGGFLLQRFVPGMELFLRDGAAYFNSKEEAVEKIKYYLEHEDERQQIADRGYEIGRDRFTSKARVKELDILIDRWFHGGIQKLS
jgi:spore maturation protein CgeB